MFGQDKETPLHRSSQYGKVDVIELLVQKGANVNCGDTVSIT